MRVRWVFSRLVYYLPAVCTFILGFFACGSEGGPQFDCGATQGNSTLVQNVCGTGTSSAGIISVPSPYPTPSPSPFVVVSPSPSPTPASCTYSTTWTITTTADPTLGVVDTTDSYTETISSSTCFGIFVGSNGTQGPIAVSVVSGTVTVGGALQTLTATGTTVTASPATQCLTGNVLETMTLDPNPGNPSILVAAPTNQIILNWIFTFTPNGC